MPFWSRKKSEVEAERETITKVVGDAVKAALASATDGVRDALRLGTQVDTLKKQISDLEISKSKKEEEFAREKREVEHMVGLERKRSEFEKEAAKREATLSVREENLKAERQRFEDAMAFRDKRFTEEVNYLKGMIGQVLEAIPNVGTAPKKRGR